MKKDRPTDRLIKFCLNPSHDEVEGRVTACARQVDWGLSAFDKQPNCITSPIGFGLVVSPIQFGILCAPHSPSVIISSNDPF